MLDPGEEAVRAFWALARSIHVAHLLHQQSPEETLDSTCPFSPPEDQDCGECLAWLGRMILHALSAYTLTVRTNGAKADA